MTGREDKRLIRDVAAQQPNKLITDTLVEVYNSWLSRRIEDLNSSLYFENPDYLYHSYLKGETL